MSTENQDDGKWLEVRIIFEPSAREKVIDLLAKCGVESFMEGFGPVSGIGQPVQEDSGITFYLPESTDLDSFSSAFDSAARASSCSVPTLSFRQVNSSDWENSWKKYWKPIQVSRSLCICPAWHEYSPPPGQLVVYLETTQAFGTGSHETTRLCLELLEAALLKQMVPTVMDLGCGTGVLGITAALFGVSQVFGIDIEANAVATAGQNATRNKVSLSLAQKSVGEVEGRYAFVCGNILSWVLLEHASAIRRIVAPGGRLLLSGILREEIPDILAAYAYPLLARREQGEWAALLFQVN